MNSHLLFYWLYMFASGLNFSAVGRAIYAHDADDITVLNLVAAVGLLLTGLYERNKWRKSIGLDANVKTIH